MIDETRQLFNAPWTVADDKDEQGRYMVLDNDMACVAKESTLNDAKRIAHLPELYDALKEAIDDACQDCVEETYQRTGMLFEPSTDGCIYPERDCCPKCRGWIELLRKVRDGE